MTGDGVSDSEMVHFPWAGRPDVRVLDALLSGHAGPEDAPGLGPVAEVLAALRAPADRGEIAAWPRALAVFREVPAPPEEPRRSWSRRRPAFGARLTAAAAVAAVALLGGGMAAAYTGSLPAALQRIAHDVLAAPRARPRDPVRPAPATARHLQAPATGRGSSASPGLCQAYQHANASQRAVAFRRLVSAAGGQDKVAAYCGWASRTGAASPPGRARGQASRPPSAPPKKPKSPRNTENPGHHGKPSTAPGHGKKKS